MLSEVYTMDRLLDFSNSEGCRGMKKNDYNINHVYGIIEFIDKTIENEEKVVGTILKPNIKKMNFFLNLTY